MGIKKALGFLWDLAVGYGIVHAVGVIALWELVNAFIDWFDAVLYVAMYGGL